MAKDSSAIRVEKIGRVFFTEFTFNVFAHEVDGGLGVKLMTSIYGYDIGWAVLRVRQLVGSNRLHTACGSRKGI